MKFVQCCTGVAGYVYIDFFCPLDEQGSPYIVQSRRTVANHFIHLRLVLD